MEFLAEIPEIVREGADHVGFLRGLPPAFRRHGHVDAASIWINLGGEWAELAGGGGTPAPPSSEWLSQALDSDAVVARAGTYFLGFGGKSARQVLVLNGVESEGHPPWEVLRHGLDAAMELALERATERRLAQIRHALGHEVEIAVTESGTAARNLEKLVARLYAASAARCYVWDATKQQPGIPGQPTEVVPARVAQRIRQAVKSRQPELFQEARSDGGVDRGVMLPLIVGKGPPGGALELIFADPQATDPIVDEAELFALAETVAMWSRAPSTPGQRIGEDSDPEPLAEATRRASGSSGGLLGASPAIESIRTRIAKVAPTELCVLILGENGTGKEVVARAIHAQSPRRHEILLAVNCSAMSETLLESELFGHEKGAFTDAQETRQGKFELASKGTLFLDEVGELSPRAQAKLLRVLEDKTILRVGGSTPIQTDARILAATNRDLAWMVREHRFREDLYFRLNVVSIELPPLRERGEDVLMLAQRFLLEHGARLGKPPLQLNESALAALRGYAWPGNVRELRNLMERLTFLHPGGAISAADLALPKDAADEVAFYLKGEEGLMEATRRFQIEFIQRQIAASGNNVTEAARRMGMHRTNLYRKMSQLGMPSQRDEADDADRGETEG